MPPLLAAYAARLRRPLAATTEETLTIEPPPPARINRAASTEQKNVPFRFVSMTRSQISSLGSARFIQPGMPAQLTRTSSRSRLRRFSAIWAGLETSKASARPRRLSGSSASTSAGSSRSLRCTTAPSAASPAASARPIPRPAPVTSAALPSRRPLIRSPPRVRAEETLRAYFARTPLDTRGSGATQPARRCSSSSSSTLDLERSRVDIDRDQVPVADEGDRASPHRLGRDVADHHAPGRAAEAAVGDEHDRVAQAAPDDRGGDREHLRHARRPGRALVADDDDFARLDDSGVDGLQARRLRAEDARRAAVAWSRSWPASLTTAPSGARLPRSTRSAPPGLNGCAAAATTSPSGSRAPAACSAIVRPSTVGASPCRCGEQLLDHRCGAAGVVQVARDVAAAGGQARHDRRRRREAVEVLELERDAGLVGDRQQVKHGVRRPAGAGDADDRVLEPGPRNERGRPNVAPDHVEDEPSRGLGPPLPWPGRLRGRFRGRSARARENRSRPPSCSP